MGAMSSPLLQPSCVSCCLLLVCRCATVGTSVNTACAGEYSSIVHDGLIQGGGLTGGLRSFSVFAQNLVFVHHLTQALRHSLFVIDDCGYYPPGTINCSEIGTARGRRWYVQSRRQVDSLVWLSHEVWWWPIHWVLPHLRQ